MEEEFRRRKIEELEKAKADKKILPLLKKINANKNYITSSSCSGRIVLLEIREGKKDARLYKTWHKKVGAEEVIAAIRDYRGGKILWLRCEPFILHVFASDMHAADEFLKKCKKAGVKRGGIQQIKPRVFIEIQGTSGFALPVKEKKEFVEGKFLRYLVKIANKMLEDNFARLEKLRKIF